MTGDAMNAANVMMRRTWMALMVVAAVAEAIL
jgi:hypothetical protein